MTRYRRTDFPNTGFRVGKFTCQYRYLVGLFGPPDIPICWSFQDEIGNHFFLVSSQENIAPQSRTQFEVWGHSDPRRFTNWLLYRINKKYYDKAG